MSHTALTEVFGSLLLNVNPNEYTGVVFVDFAKTIAVIDYSLLFLFDRTQVVNANVFT